ncbi:glutaredoxin [Sphingobacteriales bacterium UPWRP_1]|nr:hypothetical protein BVG80_08565 [Sphingobacteriales bacterium TSM_CSM]PSJ78480.1 glutaredoxin [Sphingobacteriales bacterium UPWRP_1]
MKTHPAEILLYYNPQSVRARKVLALARGIAANVKEVEYHKTPLTATMWYQLLAMLNLRPKDLLNKSKSYYQENIKGRDFDAEGWLHILMKNPDLIKAPIAVRGSKAILCNNPNDILQLQ